MVNKVNAIQTNGTNDLVKKAGCNTKIEEIGNKIPDHDKCITTNNFIKFLVVIFDERLKQSELATVINLNTVEKGAIKKKKRRKIKTSV